MKRSSWAQAAAAGYEYKALEEEGNSGSLSAMLVGGCFCLCLPLSYLMSKPGMKMAKTLYGMAHTAVNPTSQTHMLLINEYKSVLLESLEDTDGRCWVLCGFQTATNPWSDFRGAGLLALKSMWWFAHYHPNELRQVAADLALHRYTSATSDAFMNSPVYYPYSASLINVVFYVYNYLRIGSDLASKLTPRSAAKTAHLPSMGVKGSKGNVLRLFRYLVLHDDDDFSPAFGELVVACFLRTHREWLHISRSGGTLMDFQKALDVLKPLLDKFASGEKPLTVEWMRQIILG